MKALAVLLVFGMVPFATVNPILYWHVTNWRNSREGRALMTLFVFFALLVDFSTLYQLVQSFPGKWLIAVVVYAGILSGFVRFTVILVRELRAQHRRR